jgi:hypothetical protein
MQTQVFRQMRYDQDRENMRHIRSTCAGYTRHTYDIQVPCEEGGPQSTPLARPVFSQTENAVAVRAGISYAADVLQAIEEAPRITLTDCFPR